MRRRFYVSYKNAYYYPIFCFVKELLDKKVKYREIADILNEKGIKTPRKNTFDDLAVHCLMKVKQHREKFNNENMR